MSPEQRKPDEARHRGLGRGLSALIGDEAGTARGDQPARAGRTLPVAFLRPNPFQPRKNFKREELEDLANSIREKGILQPILVRPVKGETEVFEIVAGERRWRAAQLAKLHDVPVVVRELSDGESLEFAIIENVQRADLNAVEEAAAYRELMEHFAYTQERVAREVGKSRSHVANTLRLLKLPESVRTMIQNGLLTAGHGRTLISAGDPEARAREIVASALNVRQAERRSEGQTPKAKNKTEKSPDTKALETNLSNMLGLKVEILDKGKAGGEVRIAYRTLEQLDDICRRLSKFG
jgi:ParB family transcriptional regulator, chromosome partitioning protein